MERNHWGGPLDHWRPTLPYMSHLCPILTHHTLVSGSSVEYPLINPAKVNARGYVNSGTLRFDEVELIPKFSLLEFVRGGTNLNCTIAVDFTGIHSFLGN